MKSYIAFLRGINVGGNTALPMARLKSICQDTGFENVQTYIGAAMSSLKVNFQKRCWWKN